MNNGGGGKEMHVTCIREVELIRLGDGVDAGESGVCEEVDSPALGKPPPSPARTP